VRVVWFRRRLMEFVFGGRRMGAALSAFVLVCVEKREAAVSLMEWWLGLGAKRKRSLSRRWQWRSGWGCQAISWGLRVKVVGRVHVAYSTLCMFMHGQ
jgi:hypothetical protein